MKFLFYFLTFLLNIIIPLDDELRKQLGQCATVVSQDKDCGGWVLKFEPHRMDFNKTRFDWCLKKMDIEGTNLNLKYHA